MESESRIPWNHVQVSCCLLSLWSVYVIFECDKLQKTLETQRL